MRCLRIISQRSESERSFDSATAETSLPRVECCTRPRSVQDSGQDSKLRMTNVNSRSIRRTPGSRSNQKGLLTDRKNRVSGRAADIYQLSSSAADVEMIVSAAPLPVNRVNCHQIAVFTAPCA